jgi:hypothetical protein
MRRVGFGWAPAAGTIASLKVALALGGALLAGWEVLSRRRGEAPSRRRDALLLAITAASAFGFFDFTPSWIVGRVHLWEFYHHLMGARYFRELGYDRLYLCTVVADQEDGFTIPASERPVRRLDTNEVTDGATLLAEADECRRHFTPARWDAFRADLSWFRARTPPRTWARMLTDHGFNATPAWLVLARPLAGTAPLSEGRVRALAFVDPLLLVLAWAALFRAFGWRTACVALIYWGTNHPARPGWVQGAYLRQDWLAATCIGLALLRVGHVRAGGAALTAATLLRVLPGFGIAALALRSAIGCVQRRSLRLPAFERRFAVGCLAAVVAGLALSTAVSGRLDAWRDFAENSRTHFRTPHTNFVGLPAVIAFDPATSVRALKDPSQPDPYAPWHAAVRANLERRAVWRWSAVLAFTILLGRAVARAAPFEAAILGTGLLVVSVQAG